MRGLIAYRIDSRMKRGRHHRAMWVQRGQFPWKLCSVYDGGARQIIWELSTELSNRARRFAGQALDAAYEQVEKLLAQRDESRGALDEMAQGRESEALRLAIEARTVLMDELRKSREFRKLEREEHAKQLAEFERKLRERGES
jgi:curli biogenesis system outer membrane secretion channel CsgG